MLRIAADGEKGDYSAHSFLDRIIALECRSRSLPKGSTARCEMPKDGMDEFGQRWGDQLKAPINFMEPMLTTFSDSSCFIYNKLDMAEDTALKTYQFRKLLLKRPRQDTAYMVTIVTVTNLKMMKKVCIKCTQRALTSACPLENIFGC